MLLKQRVARPVPLQEQINIAVCAYRFLQGAPLAGMLPAQAGEAYQASTEADDLLHTPLLTRRLFPPLWGRTFPHRKAVRLCC